VTVPNSSSMAKETVPFDFWKIIPNLIEVGAERINGVLPLCVV